MTAPATAASTRRVRWVLGLVLAVVPLTFLQNEILGFQLSGWAWFALLCATLPLVLTEPISRRALRLLTPYLLFLAYATASLAWTPTFAEGLATVVQLAMPGLVYLVAWRLPAHLDPLPEFRLLAQWGLVAAAVTVVVVVGLGGPFGLQMSTPRPMAISLVVLFVCASATSTSWRTTLAYGLAAIAIAMATGSRASAAVLILVILVTPALRISWRGRLLAGLACAVLLVSISQTTAFRERFFFDTDASLVDILTLSENVDTAGRRELWPQLVDACAPSAATGAGMGASGELSLRFTDGAMPHPHNEYLRTYCDVGVVASAAFWGFFAWAGWRSWRGLRRGAAPALHGAAALLVTALFVLSITDNPIVYTAHFMAPLAAVLGLSDRRATAALSGGPPARAARRPDVASAAGRR